MKLRRAPIAASAMLACLALATPLRAADKPVELGAEVTVDVVGVAKGGADHRARVLSNVDLTAALDLEALAGWSGARAFVYVLDNHGLRPNDAAGKLEGVNNIEVPKAGTRLFEAWVE